MTKWKHAVDAQKKRKREANGDAAGEGSADKKIKGENAAKAKAENVASAGEYPSRSHTKKHPLMEPRRAVSSAKGSPAPSVKPEQPRIIRKERKLPTITTEKRPERSAKSDNPPGLEPAYRSGSSEKDDAVRLKGATMSYDALSFDSIAGAYPKCEEMSPFLLLDRSDREGHPGGTSAGTGTGRIR